MLAPICIPGSSGVCVPDRQVLVAGDRPQPGRPAHRQARQEHDRPTGCHTMSFVTFVSMVCQARVRMLLCAWLYRTLSVTMNSN